MAEAETEKDTELSLKLWVVLSRAFDAVQAHAQADVARRGLTIMEFGVMEVLYHKGPLTLGEVQRKILVTSGGVTYLVDRLAAKGLVERRRCETDRRAYYAALTPAGQEMIAEIFPRHAAAIDRALGGLDDAQKEQAVTLLRTLGRYAAEALRTDG
jgi:MarR family 2-MHQ and catechol resistance regulon transcriptional repressor